MDSQPMGLLGVSVCKDNQGWRYFIAVASTRPIDETLEEYIVPAATWAVFSGGGDTQSGIQDLERRIWTEWLPNSEYDYAEGATDMEVYLNNDPQNRKYEVWFPVVKK